MKKLFITILFFLFSLLSLGSLIAQNQVPVIELSGTPYDRGLQHGQKLKSQINEVIEKWKSSLKKDTGKDADEEIKAFLAQSQFINSIQKWSPNIFEEVKGIAAGSNQSIDDILAFNLIDEYWGYLDRNKNQNLEKNKCTAIGVAKYGNAPTIISQNVDIDNYLNGYQVLLHIKEDKNTPEQYIMSAAGFLGFAGMNKKLSLVINALTDVNSSIQGLPVTFVTREILTKTSANEAIKFMKNIKHATGQNYLIGTKDKVYTFEASANQLIEFNPHNRKLVYHTNHSLVNEDIKPWRVEIRKAMLNGTRKTNSVTRLNGVNTLLEKHNHQISEQNIKNLMRSKEDPVFPICVPYKEGGSAFTFSSVVFTIGKKSFAEVTFGEPDKNDYEKHYFN